MRIAGVDPGLRKTGWGVIDSASGRLRHVAHGVISPRGDDMAARLADLCAGLTAALAPYGPELAAVEKTFVNRDPAGALVLGQARGIALLVPAQMGIAVREIAPNAVKKAVVGVGHADKTQVAHMINILLPGVGVGPGDAADALAVAIACAQGQSTADRVAAALERAR